jgi:hypothetical protein
MVRMRSALSVLIVPLLSIAACTAGGARPGAATHPAPPASATPAPSLTPGPSGVSESQLADDLAARLGISRERIVFRGAWPVVWQAGPLRCPALLDPGLSPGYVMIVTEDGARYERLAEAPESGKGTATAFVFSVAEALYIYYVVGEQVLFCPPE